MSILFATPCYGGMLHEAHFMSCMQLKEDLTQLGVEHDWLTGNSESLVHRGRMKMAAKYLKGSSYKFLMWLDADIEFTSNDVAALWNMATDPKAPADIAVGVYAMKKRDKQWFAAWKDGKLVKDLDQFGDQPIEVDYAGTGFMLISREALATIHTHLAVKYAIAKKLREAMGGDLNGLRKLVADEMLGALQFDFEEDEGRIPAFFTAHIFNDGLESEDYHFCRIAREAGLKIMMHPRVRLKHWGQYAFGDPDAAAKIGKVAGHA
jgi:hypothetical protein